MRSRLRPRVALVGVASLDMRRGAAHSSELGSQLLLGEVVHLSRGRPSGAWRRVASLADGYRGWVRSWGLVPCTARRAAEWRRRATARADLPWAEVREGPGSGAMITPLFWGARVVPGRRRGRFRRVELPDGARGWVESRALRLAGKPAVPLVERVKRLLGVPYLWGGRTPAGMDCSGLVQLLLEERGAILPRDAADQEKACRPLRPGESPEAGDLAFFGAPGERTGHVGVLLGEGEYVHSRGRVRVNSLVPGNQMFDNTLYRQFRGVRRPRRGGLRPARRGPRRPGEPT